MSLALNILLISRIFQTFSESSKAVLTYNGKFKRFALVDTVSNLIRFLAIVALFNFNPTIDNYLFGQAVFCFVYGFFSLFICREFFKISEISIKNIKGYFSKFKLDYSKQRFDQLVGIVPQHLDLVILGYFTDLSTVGIFRIAKRLIEPVTYIVSVITPIVQNNLSKDNIKVNFSNLVKNFLLPISVLLTATYFYFGDEFINLISGPTFKEAYNPLLILLIGYLTYLNTFWIRQLLLFANLIHFHAYSRLIALCVFIFSSFLLVSNFGAIGIAIALSLSMVSQKIYEFYAYYKNIKQN